MLVKFSKLATVAVLAVCWHGQAVLASGVPDLAEAELYRQLATHVYWQHSAESPPAGVKHRAEFEIRDHPTGLDVEVFELSRAAGGKTLIVSFGGTDLSGRDLLHGASRGIKDVITDLVQGAPSFNSRREIEQQYAAALNTARQLQQAARRENAELVFVGHSLGGGLAQYAAITLGERAEVFSAAPLGETITSRLSNALIQSNAGRIRHYVTPGDPVWFIPRTIRSSQHFGTVFFTPPPRDLDGIVASDQYLARQVRLEEKVGDGFARHMLHTELPLRIPASLTRGMTPEAALAQVPIWRAVSAVPKAAPLESQVAALDSMTANAKRVVVFGEGKQAAELQQRLVKRLGAGNVMRIVDDLPAERLQRVTRDFSADVIIGFGTAMPRSYDERERILLRADVAAKFSDAARSLTWLGRMAQGLAKDSDQVTNPVWRSRVQRFDDLFGDSLAGRDVKQFLGRWETGQKYFDRGLALAHDSALLSRGEWRLYESHVIGQVIDEGAQAAMDHLYDAFVERGAKLSAVASSGIIPVAKGAWSQYRAGGVVDANAAEHYLDGLVAVSWGAVGYALTQNPAVAKRFSDAGTALAGLGRTLTEDQFVNRAHGKRISQHFEQWSTQQISLAHRTTARLPTFEEYLSDSGISAKSIGKELAAESRNIHATAVRIQQAKFPQALATMNVNVPRNAATRLASDLHTTGKLLGSGQRKIVIADPYRQGEAVEKWAVQRYGQNNVKILRQSHTRYVERRVAGDFGADAIVRVTAANTTPDTGRIGGISLDTAANIIASEAAFGNGDDFSVIFTGPAGDIDIHYFRMFVTALWSVYYSDASPGISIDPIAWGAERQLVRYIGRVINTDLGRVMREADYQMKQWAVGTSRPDMEGFRDVDTIAGADSMTYADAARRFWFVPADMTFKAGDGVFLFDHGRMVLKTELMVVDRQTHALDSDRQFAQFFTDHYQQIAAKYPIYQELFEYAKLVSIAQYLKQRGVALHWFLMAHLDDVLTEDSKATVATLSKGSRFLKDVRIEGGVDMSGRYVLDESAAQAIRGTLARIGQTSQAQDAAQRNAVTAAAPARSGTANVARQVFSIVPRYSVTAAKDVRGVGYQTDITVRQGTQPGLELVRYFSPAVDGVYSDGEFGKGWHLLRPYRLVPIGRPETPFLNAFVPARVALRNLLTGRDETLIFDDKSSRLAGYYPADTQQSRIVGAFWTAAGGMRLVDKLGNEFWFGEDWALQEMHLSEEFGIRFEYGYEEASRSRYSNPPYRLARAGQENATDLLMLSASGDQAELPQKLNFTDAATGVSKVFTFGESPSGLLGYSYDAAQPLDRQFITLRNDGSHVLMDAAGNEIWFDANLRFHKLRQRVVKALAQGSYQWSDALQSLDFLANHTVRLVYEFQDGKFRIAQAQLFSKGSTTMAHHVEYRYSNESLLAGTSRNHQGHLR